MGLECKTDPLRRGILCDTCGKPADSVHFLPRLGHPRMRIEAACKDHDPGGDRLWLDDLAHRPYETLYYLEHRPRKGDSPVVALLRWLGFEGGKTLEAEFKRAQKGIST